MCVRFHICFRHFSEVLSRGALSLRGVTPISGSQTAFICSQYSKIGHCFQKLCHLSPEAQGSAGSVILVQHSPFSSPISFTAAWLFLSSPFKLESILIKCGGCYCCFLYMQGYYPDLSEEKTPEMLYTDPCIFNTMHTHEGNRLNNALES